MEYGAYSFEAPHEGPAFEGHAPQDRSVIVDPIETGNWSRQFERLHVGDVAIGGQVIVFYERGNDTGIATLRKTDATNGMHGWDLHTVSIKESGDTSQDRYDEVTVSTATPEGFMNRHCFIEPGHELLVDGPRTKSIGTVASVHAIEPRRLPEVTYEQPKTLRARFIHFWTEHRPFAKAA
jgi:hypothetical protein